MAISSIKNLAILKSLPDRSAKNAFFAGGRAAVGQITQVEEKTLIHRYVGKVRGVVIQFSNEWIFDTSDEALKNAQDFLADCKKEAIINS